MQSLKNIFSELTIDYSYKGDSDILLSTGEFVSINNVCSFGKLIKFDEFSIYFEKDGDTRIFFLNQFFSKNINQNNFNEKTV